MSYIYRFKNRRRTTQIPKKPQHFSSLELDFTFWKIVSLIQHQCFHADIEFLANDKEVSAQLRNLCPFLQAMEMENNTYTILRVGGRLLKAPITYDAKFPALLPKHHRFTQLYLEYLHQHHMHAGPKALIGILRQKIWIINARDLVRKIVNKCVHCFHYQPKLQNQIMGNLPADRFKAQRPFLVTGVDFCGPFFISHRIRGKQPFKSYLAVFVCFASKAVHFEIVSDLSTNNFLL